MERKNEFAAAATGALSALLFFFAYGFDAGILLMLMPTLPLFLLGMSRKPILLFYAAAMASAIVLAFSFATGGVGSTIFFIGFMAIPVLLFAPAAITRQVTSIEFPIKATKDDPTKKGSLTIDHFTPMGLILADISMYVALVMAAVLIHFSDGGQLDARLTEHLQESFTGLQPGVQAKLEQMAQGWGFIIFAASGWWWVFLLYLHALLANWMLSTQKQALRPSLVLSGFSMPTWVLAVICGSALLSVVTTGNMAFIAKTTVLIMLLPYFLLGLTVIRRNSERIPGGNTTIFILYFLIFMLLWPVLLVAALGIGQHCNELTRKIP